MISTISTRKLYICSNTQHFDHISLKFHDRFRLELRSVNNSDFPAQATENFASAMRSNSKLLTRGNVKVDCTRASRAKAATNSPFAVAYEYIHIISNVFTVFLGVQPKKVYLLHTKKNHSTYYKQNKNFGLFGHALAAIGMNETSQRGALHHHLCAWLGLQSRLLEITASFPDIVQEIGRVIDSQFKAEIDKKHHVLDLLSTYMTKSIIPNKPKQVFTSPALNCRPCAPNDLFTPDVNSSAFKDICSYNCTRLNIHHHSFTCFKGGSGRAGCRMSFPQALVEKTKPVQLTSKERNQNKNDPTWEICDDILPTKFQNILYPIRRNRITVYELKRGTPFVLQEIPYSIQNNQNDDVLKEFVLKVLNDIIQYHNVERKKNENAANVKSILDWLDMLSGRTLSKLYTMLQKDISKRNGLVVPFNDVITTVLGCNTSIQFLGNQEQSKNSLFYLVPYLTKDNVSLSNCISIIKKSYDDVTNRPSIAKDSGTDFRFAKHMSMRILNLLDTKMEISDTQAAAALLGMEAQIITDTFWYIKPSSHIEYVKICIRQQPKLMNFNETDENLLSPLLNDNESDSLSISSDDSTSSSMTTTSLEEHNITQIPDTIEALFVENVPELQNEMIDDVIRQNKVLYVQGAGRGRVYKRGSKLPEITIQDPYHYFYRGEHFAKLNRLEYYTLVQIVDRKSSSTRQKRNTGIKSTRFDFAPSHVLFESHQQMLRFHQPTPMFSNNNHQPKHPGKEIHPNDPSYGDFRKKANNFALYYLTLFRPESEHFNAADKPNTYKYDWITFKKWIHDLEIDNRIISHCRLLQIQTHIDGLNTSNQLREVARNYRDRERRIWTEREKEQFRHIDKHVNLRESQNCSTFEVDDYESQNTMTANQFRIALKMTTYSSTQMALIHDLCPLLNGTATQNISQVQCLSDIVYRKKDDIDLVENANFLYETNMSDIIKPNTSSEESTYPSFDTHHENTLNAHNAEYESEYQSRIIDELNFFVSETIERERNIILGDSQRNVLKYWIVKLCTIKTAKIFQTFNENYAMPLILMLGLPGTGKSFVIDAISQCVNYLQLGHVLKTAHYGVAAMNIKGSTLHKIFKISCVEGINNKSDLKDQDLIDLQNRLQAESLFMIIIDEISNVPPHLLQRVNRRLQSIRQCNKPFGGLAVLLVGDFLQKKPPGSLPLVHGLMHMTVYEDIKEKKNNSAFSHHDHFPYTKQKKTQGIADQTSNTYLGLKLFERFQLFTLKEQQRASDDNEHITLLDKMSKPNCKVTVEDLSIYAKLTKTDVDNDFQNACYIVATNRERHNISFHMAQRYALKHKYPIIRWRLNIKWWMNRPSINEELDLLDKDPIFYDHFIKGIESYCTENINTNLMIGNGTKVKLHSLVFETREQENYVTNLVLNSSPGQIITLPFAPICVNVALSHNQIDDKIKCHLQRSMVPVREYNEVTTDEIVVSILKSKHNAKQKGMPTIVTSACYTPSKVFVQQMFPLQLAAAVTVDKAQGRTLNKVVACLSKRYDNLYEMDINSIFVALSRVRKRSDLRLLIHSGSSAKHQLEYIESLTHDKEYFDYMNGFEHNQEEQPKSWNRNTVLLKLKRR